MAPLISPDFSQVVELKPGTYKARFTDCQTKQSAKGDTYLNWKLEVFGNDDTALNGKGFTHNTMVTGPGARNFRTLVRATVDANYEGGPIETDQILGKEVQVVLKQGKDRDGNPSDFPEVSTMTRLGT